MPVTAPPYCVNRAPPAGDAVAGPGVRYGRRDYRSPACGLSGGGCPRRVLQAQSPRAHPPADLGCARGQPGGGGVGSELLRAGAGQPGARHRRLRRLERGFCGARCAPSLGLWLSRSTTSTLFHRNLLFLLLLMLCLAFAPPSAAMLSGVLCARTLPLRVVWWRRCLQRQCKN